MSNAALMHFLLEIIIGSSKHLRVLLQISIENKVPSPKFSMGKSDCLIIKM